MDIYLHWTKVLSGHAEKDEKTKSFKHRLGCQPINMTQSLSVKGLDNRINTKWKEVLTAKLSNRAFRRDTKCSVFVNNSRFEVSGKNISQFVNNLANLILRTNKSNRDKLGVATKQSVLQSL